MIYPFEGSYPVTRGFIKYDPNMPAWLEDPKYGKTHRGIDFALPLDTKLRAAIGGQVTAAGWSPDGAGNIVVIRSGAMLVKCFHMSSVAVKLGDIVAEGQFVGQSGATGNAIGAHLHFQVENPAGVAVDPMQFLSKEEDMSTIGDYEVALAWPVFFGYEATQADKNAWRGAESNTAFRAWAASPQAKAYTQYREDLKAAAAGSSVATDPQLIALANAAIAYVKGK